VTREEKITFAKQNLASILGCDANVWDVHENVFIESEKWFFRIATFGKNAVMLADKQLIGWLREQFATTPAQEILDTDNRYLINEKLRSLGKKLSGECMWYLHLSPKRKSEPPTDLRIRLYEEADMPDLHATMQSQDAYRELTHAVEAGEDYVLAAAAYDNETLVAVTACETYKDVWDIGVDTRSAYRGRGLAAYLVKMLALETEKRGKVAGYNTWSGNIASTKVALQCGFSPVWLAHFCEDL